MRESLVYKMVIESNGAPRERDSTIIMVLEVKKKKKREKKSSTTKNEVIERIYVHFQRFEIHKRRRKQWNTANSNGSSIKGKTQSNRYKAQSKVNQAKLLCYYSSRA